MGIVDVTFNEYLGTATGLFNFLEIGEVYSQTIPLTSQVGGLVLFGLMCAIKESTNVNLFLFSVSYAFSFNGIHIMFCSFFSRRTMEIMKQVFYNVFYQMTAAVMYAGASVKLLKESPQVPVHAVVGLITGGLHTVNFLVVSYNTYASQRS